MSARYMKPWWKISMWIHRIGGLIILTLTLYFSIAGLQRLEYQFRNDLHAILGLIIFFIVPALVLSGFFARDRMNKIRWEL